VTSLKRTTGDGTTGAGGAVPRGSAQRGPATASGQARRATGGQQARPLVSFGSAGTAAAPAGTASPGISAAGVSGAPPGIASPPRPGTRAGRRPAAQPPARRGAGELFTRYTRSYLKGREGQQVTILAAGCTTAGDLVDGGFPAGGDVVVTLIDDDQPSTLAAAAVLPGLPGATLGDLRSVPLAPRAFDIVHCASLLERIEHAELVLDRLLAALKPGGLLLLRCCDASSAAGFLDRALPAVARRMIWRRRRPGEPGPHRAVYERLTSASGLQAFIKMRGLVTAERQVLGGLAGGLPAGPPGFQAAQKLVARLSFGRFTDAHEEILFVLRKPENRFARILLSTARAPGPPRSRRRAAWPGGHGACTLRHAWRVPGAGDGPAELAGGRRRWM
jgi:SAM-dependent methyltransferase